MGRLRKNNNGQIQLSNQSATNGYLLQKQTSITKNIQSFKTMQLLQMHNGKTFGKIMAYIKEGTQFELPSGSGCRDYYRAYAHMLSVGREGVKELIASVIDDTAHPFSIAYTMVQFLGYSELIFGRVL